MGRIEVQKSCLQILRYGNTMYASSIDCGDQADMKAFDKSNTEDYFGISKKLTSTSHVPW